MSYFILLALLEDSFIQCFLNKFVKNSLVLSAYNSVAIGGTENKPQSFLSLILYGLLGTDVHGHQEKKK